MFNNRTTAKHTDDVPVTARHMADAVGFLVNVAREAGLQKIAVRLGRVRMTLIKLAVAHAPRRLPSTPGITSNRNTSKTEH
jgi:hypothetical protein